MNEKYKVLVVDDEREILSMLSRYLNRSGNFDLTTQTNPVLAIDSLSHSSYDIILLDIMMPQMNGLDALEKIMEINSNQKVIMMTAYSTLDKVLKSHKHGATHYVMKPFDSLGSLEKKVLEVLKS
ncbi:response regulator [Arcobacter roscoffensis]|uniref:Response regulator n=1 Tax=Arcobacter roscoffensis TaxID=2961520 RepID=A0ABY5E8L6_9BACT|nr:response regulator [Arcobacter roscoffensis]UTJ07058.1 response regulator [Arcobacter roscoffensis]